MKKPFVTVESRLVLDKRIFIESHNKWFEEMAIELFKPEIAKWGELYKQGDEYFCAVISLMKTKYPELDESALIMLARGKFFDIASSYVEKNGGAFLFDNIERLKNIDGYSVGIISSAEENFLRRVLKKGGIENVFDAVYGTELSVEDSIVNPYDRFQAKHGEPKHFIRTQYEFDNLKF